jgi:molecular chaperone DnaK
VARDLPAPVTTEIGPIGLRSANLRLRSEMAAPEIGAPADAGAGSEPPGVLPVPPAETPADFRPVAERAHDVLTDASADDFPGLRDAYLAFVAAIRAGESDRRLHELGAALAAELAALG